MSDADWINAVIAGATVVAVFYSVKSARLAARANEGAARIGEESIRIGKANTKHNAEQLAQAEKQHRLSVRPMLITCIKRRDINHDKGSHYWISLSLESVGAGPAVIKDLEVVINGKVLPKSANRHEYPVEVLERVTNGAKPDVEHYGMPAKKGAMLPGDKQELIRFRYDFPCPITPELKQKVNALFENVHIRVGYMSIYEDEDLLWSSEEDK